MNGRHRKLELNHGLRKDVLRTVIADVGGQQRSGLVQAEEK